MNMHLRPPSTRTAISGQYCVKILSGSISRLIDSSTFCTRVRESEIWDMPPRAFFNSSITFMAEAHWKADLSSSESLSTCFCSISATAFSNALFLGGGSGTTLRSAKGTSTIARAMVELEGAGLCSLDGLPRRVYGCTRDLPRLFIASSAAGGMASQESGRCFLRRLYGKLCGHPKYRGVAVGIGNSDCGFVRMG